MPFSSYLPGLVPTTLQRTTWASYLGALGGVMDALVLRTKQGIQARFLSKAPDDAVLTIGGDRMIPRGTPYSAGAANEAISTYGARLLAAWTSWAWAGSPYGLLTALATLGYTNVAIEIPNGNQYTLSGGALVITAIPGGAWTPTVSGMWNRFTVIFGTTLPTTPTAPSDWTTALPSSTSDEVNAIRRVIKLWKPGFAICDRIVATNGNIWGFPVSGNTWGSGGKVWGTPSKYTTWSP